VGDAHEIEREPKPGSTDPAVVSTPDGRRHAPSASPIGSTLMVLRRWPLARPPTPSLSPLSVDPG
jgi:hypothetical protein